MANFHDDSEPLPSFRPRRYTTLYCRRRRRRKFLVSFAPQLLKSSHGWYGLRSRWLAYSGASFLHLNNGLLFIYHRLLIPHDTSCRCFFFYSTRTYILHYAPRLHDVINTNVKRRPASLVYWRSYLPQKTSGQVWRRFGKNVKG